MKVKWLKLPINNSGKSNVARKWKTNLDKFQEAFVYYDSLNTSIQALAFSKYSFKLRLHVCFILIYSKMKLAIERLEQVI